MVNLINSNGHKKTIIDKHRQVLVINKSEKVLIHKTFRVFVKGPEKGQKTSFNHLN